MSSDLSREDVAGVVTRLTDAESFRGEPSVGLQIAAQLLRTMDELDREIMESASARAALAQSEAERAKDVYIVEGVYRHRVIGVFPSIAAAKCSAEEAQKDQRDRYHDWSVLRYTPCEHTPGDGEEVARWSDGKWTDARLATDTTEGAGDMPSSSGSRPGASGESAPSTMCARCLNLTDDARPRPLTPFHRINHHQPYVCNDCWDVLGWPHKPEGADLADARAADVPDEAGDAPSTPTCKTCRSAHPAVRLAIPIARRPCPDPFHTEP